MSRFSHIILALVAIPVAWGCSDPAELTVDVRTDWRPFDEFVQVRTELSPEPFLEVEPGRVRRVETGVTPGQDFFYGARVAEYDEVALGHRYVRVSLVDDDGAVVASREADLQLEGSFALTVVLTRNCRDRLCPGASDDPSHTACLDGQCVDPRCTASTPERCGVSSCAVDADCAGRAGCPDARCALGVCLCSAPLADAGVDAGPRRDAGIDAGPERDAGPGCDSRETACTDGDDEDCDGLTDCADPDCNGAGCDDGDACTTGDACSGGTCTGTARDCDDGNPCTDDSCGAGGCAHTNNTASCNDGNACTTGDRCSGGSCVGVTRDCDDGNPCTTDSCTPGSGCVNSALANHSTCGGYNMRCCSGSCVNIYTDERHCGGCGLACTSGLTCSQFSESGRTGASCRTCTANSQCPPSGATCWTVSLGGSGRCQCQSDAHCAAGQSCYDGPGENYCFYP